VILYWNSVVQSRGYRCFEGLKCARRFNIDRRVDNSTKCIIADDDEITYKQRIVMV